MLQGWRPQIASRLVVLTAHHVPPLAAASSSCRNETSLRPLAEYDSEHKIVLNAVIAITDDWEHTNSQS